MGTDIHMYVEKYNTELNQWELVDPEGIAYQNKLDLDLGFHDWFSGRNYGIFYLLAGVRGEGRGLPCLSKPRGVPIDASSDYFNEVERCGGDAHSHSFYTVKELLDLLNKLPRKIKHKIDKETNWFEHQFPVIRGLGDPKNVRIVFYFDN